MLPLDYDDDDSPLLEAHRFPRTQVYLDPGRDDDDTGCGALLLWLPGLFNWRHVNKVLSGCQSCQRQPDNY